MTPARRALCPRCQRPLPACLCSALRPLAHRVQVAILQHPLEAREAKGTARLAQLCLAHCRLWVGECFDAGALHAALAAPWCEADECAPRRALLLYPSTPPDAQQPMACPIDWPTQWLAEPERLRLVVLDASWRKSRKLLWANPLLQSLPRLALRPQAPSLYRIRRAHAAHQLSTIEAIAAALEQLEPGCGAPAGLRAALHDFVALQLGLRAAMLESGHHT